MNARKCLCGCAALVNLNSEWVCAACADARFAAEERARHFEMSSAEAMALVLNHEGHIERLNAELAAARAENETLRKRSENAEYQISFMLKSISKYTEVEAKSPVDAVHHVHTLMQYCKNRDEQLSALRARPDDARVKWEADADCDGPYAAGPTVFRDCEGNGWYRCCGCARLCARSVLAADSEVKP